MRLRKTLSLATCVIWITTNSGFSMTPPNLEIVPQRETPSFLQIEIPDQLARVEEVYEAPAKLEPRLLLHIQNAHGNYQAQTKIKELLSYLHDTYGFDLLFVEGAAEDLNPEYLNFFPEPEKNLELAKVLAKKGQMTGPDLFLMEAPKDVVAVGIEEPELYRGNYQAFKKVYNSRSDIDLFLDTLISKLDLLSSRYFNPDTRNMLQEWKKFQDGQRDFLPFMKGLSRNAKKILDLDLESLFAQLEWPQLTRLLAMQAMENEINREQAVVEKKKLLEFLKAKEISPAIIRGVERLEEKRIYMNRLKKDEKQIQYVPRHLLERLIDEAGAKGFKFQDYPAFSLYAGYLILESEIESRALFEEVERLFQKILDELTVTEEEKDLLELFRDAELLRKLLYLEVTRKEWARAFYRIDWIRPASMVKRLMAVQERLNSEAGQQFREAITPKMFTNLNPLGAVFEAAFQFYDFARKREASFHYRIEDEMKTRKKDKAILITGGFHTSGLMELFKEDEVSYGILTPQMTTADGREQYIASMLQNHPSMFDLANLEVFNLLQSLETIKTLDGDQARVLRSKVEAYLEVANFESLQDAEEHLNYVNQNKLNGLHIELRLNQEDPKNPWITIHLNGKAYTTEDGEVVVPIVADSEGRLKPASYAKAVPAPAIPEVLQGRSAVSPALVPRDTAARLPGLAEQPNGDGAVAFPITATTPVEVQAEIGRLLKSMESLDERDFAPLKSKKPGVELPDGPDLSSLRDVLRTPISLKDLDGILTQSRDTEPRFNEIVIALLLNGLLQSARENVEGLQELADVLEALNAPVKSEPIRANSVIDFDFQAGTATVVLDHNFAMTPAQILKMGDLLKPAANRLIKLNVVIPSDDSEELQAQIQKAIQDARDIWSERLTDLYVQQGLNPENAADQQTIQKAVEDWVTDLFGREGEDFKGGRLSITASSETGLRGVLPNVINQSVSWLYNLLRNLGRPVESRSEIAEGRSALFYSEAESRFVSADSFQGHQLKSDIAMVSDEEVLAYAVAAALLAVYKGNPEAIREKTMAALSKLEADDEFSKQWGLNPDNFAQFANAVQTAIIALQAHLKTNSSA